ncbi:MAG TPA: heavy metal transporter, partial [Emticicia sp.]
MTTIIKNNKGWIAGILTAFATSLCCITPVLALLGGASGLASSFSWIEPFRPYLIGLT